MPTIWYCSFSDYSLDNLKFKSQLTFSSFTAVNHRPVGRSGSKGCARTPSRPQRSTFLLTSPSPYPSPLFHSLHFSCGLWLSFLVLCSETVRKHLLRRLLRGATLLRLRSITGVDFGSFFRLKEIKVCIVPFFVWPLCLSGFFQISVVFCGQKEVFSAQERLSSLRNKHIH